jgi:glycosyltransferase involved in cell wall biosynthesis
MHGCYRSSRLATGVVAAMTTAHRLLGTWLNTVDRFVALSHFSARKFVEGGLPANKITVKPNFLSPDPGVGDGAGRYALFVGRLAPEKGIATLLQAWDRLSETLPLKILGDGPLAPLVQEHAAKNNGIEWLGRQTGPEVLRHLQAAACLVMPSEWYECCPKTLIESLAVGTPAVVSRLGAMAEMIDHERTGLHFEPRNANDLAVQVKRIVADAPNTAAMREQARAEFEHKYTAAANYEQLMNIYASVVQTQAALASQPDSISQCHQDTIHDRSNIDTLAQSL